jgi:hypothetical protein
MSFGDAIHIDLDVQRTEMSAVATATNMVLLLAIKDHATEVWFEPQRLECKLRYRVGGNLIDMVPFPGYLGQSFINWLKALASLDYQDCPPVLEKKVVFKVYKNLTEANIRIERDNQKAIVRFSELTADVAAAASEMLGRHLLRIRSSGDKSALRTHQKSPQIEPPA